MLALVSSNSILCAWTKDSVMGEAQTPMGPLNKREGLYHLVELKTFHVVFKRRVATQSRADIAALRPPPALLGAGGSLQSQPYRRNPSGLRLGLMAMEKGPRQVQGLTERAGLSTEMGEVHWN